MDITFGLPCLGPTCTRHSKCIEHGCKHVPAFFLFFEKRRTQRDTVGTQPMPKRKKKEEEDEMHYFLHLSSPSSLTSSLTPIFFFFFSCHADIFFFFFSSQVYLSFIVFLLCPFSLFCPCTIFCFVYLTLSRMKSSFISSHLREQKMCKQVLLFNFFFVFNELQSPLFIKPSS